MQAAERFAQHPKLSEVIDQEVGPVFDQQLRIAFPADVPMDLEAMFRRGSEWETGVEHLLVVEVIHDLLCSALAQRPKFATPPVWLLLGTGMQSLCTCFCHCHSI